jgi:hypothetical protein
MKSKKFWKNVGLIVLGAALGVGAVYGIQNRKEIGNWCKDQWDRRKQATVEGNNEPEAEAEQEEPRNEERNQNRNWRHRRFGRQNQAA